MQRKDENCVRVQKLRVCIWGNHSLLHVQDYRVDERVAFKDMQESVLSDDLLQELGDMPDLIVNKKKSSKNDSLKDKSLPEYAEKKLEKLSKKNRKRFTQIEKRKERESKRHEYMETISNHVISDTQRRLLLKATSLGQIMSLKETLSYLLRKEKAGLVLSEEEKGLLYKEKVADFDPTLFSDAVISPSSKASEPGELRVIDGDNVQSIISKEIPASSPEVDEEESNAQTTVVDDVDTVALIEQHMQSTLPNNAATKLSVPQLDLSKLNRRQGKLQLLRSYLPAGLLVRPRRRPLRANAASQTVHQTICNSQSSSKKRKMRDSELGSLQEPGSITESPSDPVKKKSSFGKSLLMQFSKLTKDTDFKEVEENSSMGDNEEHAWFDPISLPDKAYHVEKFVAPVDELGHVSSSEASRTTVDKEMKDSNINKLKYNRVNRPAEIQASRMQLPVCAMEQEIIEAIHENEVIILCGETGSGKSTQIPQFLYEAGYAERGFVGITQPRRVAVISTSERVNYEMGQNNNDKPHTEGRLAGYQIRYDSGTVGSDTKVKFMTDGILLREITQDILLRQYSVIILDEAHERNVNTDILLGMLSRAVPLRKQISLEEHEAYQKLAADQKLKYEKPLQPLKLIIMSATLRVTDFQSETLFQPIPPVIQVEARQYPVTVHFSKKTELRNYLQATYHKVCQIHRKLPHGGILVFLTGKREIMYMCHKLQKTLGRKQKVKSHPNDGNNMRADEKDEEDGEDVGNAANVFDFEDAGEAGELKLSKNEDNVDEVDYSRYNQHDDDGISIKSEISDADLMKESDDEGEYEDQTESKGSDLDGTSRSDDKVRNVDRDHDKEDENDDENEAAALRRKMLTEVLKVCNDPENAEQIEGQNTETMQIENENELMEHGPTAAELDEIEEIPQLKPLIFPLFAMMAPQLQARIFAEVPEGYRLIVVATNVAETSITIPNITYVVDAGRQKTKVYKSNGNTNSKDDEANSSANMSISKFEIQWVSKASADQRSGRAGRTGPGHCYRLFSSNFYHEYMPDFQPPEILTTPLEDLVLQMKSLGIKYIEQFPFPTIPSVSRLQAAMKLLAYLGAVQLNSTLKSNNSYLDILHDVIDSNMKDEDSIVHTLIKEREHEEKLHGELTVIGKDMANFPIHPRLGKILTMACRAVISKPSSIALGVLSYVLSLVSVMAERSPFVRDDNHLKQNKESGETSREKDSDSEEERVPENEGKLKAGENLLSQHPFGDAFARLRALGAFLFTAQKNGVVTNNHRSNRKVMQKLSEKKEIEELAKNYHLHIPTLQRVLDLRSQLQSISSKMIQAQLGIQGESLVGNVCPSMSPPTVVEEVIIRQLLLSGYADSVARKATVNVIQDMFKNQAEGQNMGRRKKYTAYLSGNPAIKQPLYLHPQSNLYPTDPMQEMPEFIVYHGLQYNTKGDTLFMLEASVIDMNWLASMTVDSTLLKLSAPLNSPAPCYDAPSDTIYAFTVPKYGQHNWKLPVMKKTIKEILNIIHEDKGKEANANIPLGYRKEDEEIRWFARFLLEGQIVLQNILKQECFILSLAMITQNKMHPKILSLLRQLVLNEITSKGSLLKKLRADGNFLVNDIQALLKPEHRPVFRNAWHKLIK